MDKEHIIQKTKEHAKQMLEGEGSGPSAARASPKSGTRLWSNFWSGSTKNGMGKNRRQKDSWHLFLLKS